MNLRSTDPAWYVLYTRPRFEKKIVQTACELDYKCYLPTRMVINKWSDRMKKIEEPLFKNYVFVNTALSKGSTLLTIPGVIKFVSVGGKPSPVPESDLQKIHILESGKQDIQYESFYSTGDKVKVVNGVFLGLEGIFMKKLNESRLLLRIPLLKQAISVEMSVSDIVKIS